MERRKETKRKNRWRVKKKEEGAMRKQEDWTERGGIRVDECLSARAPLFE